MYTVHLQVFPITLWPCRIRSRASPSSSSDPWLLWPSRLRRRSFRFDQRRDIHEEKWRNTEIIKVRIHHKVSQEMVVCRTRSRTSGGVLATTSTRFRHVTVLLLQIGQHGLVKRNATRQWPILAGLATLNTTNTAHSRRGYPPFLWTKLSCTVTSLWYQYASKA